MPQSISKSCVLCINMYSVLKYFKTMVYDDFMMWDIFLNIHIWNMMYFYKKLFYFYFHFMDFIFDFVNLSIFILTRPKSQFFLGVTYRWT